MSDELQTIGTAISPQAGLLKHVQGKLLEAKQNEVEMVAALDTATRHKWQVRPLRNAVKRAGREVAYYDKVVAALEAGYVVMPPVECEAFAVRISDRKRLPNRDEMQHNSGWHHGRDMVTSTDSPPIREGKHVSPSIHYYSWYYTRDNDKGKPVKYRVEQPLDFDPKISFPFVIAKPAIMEATEQAMSLKIFDEIAICPHRGIRKRDPIILGRVKHPSRPYTWLNFVIAWVVRPEYI